MRDTELKYADLCNGFFVFKIHRKFPKQYDNFNYQKEPHFLPMCAMFIKVVFWRLSIAFVSYYYPFPEGECHYHLNIFYGDILVSQIIIWHIHDTYNKKRKQLIITIILLYYKSHFYINHISYDLFKWFISIVIWIIHDTLYICLLYTSDAADE